MRRERLSPFRFLSISSVPIRLLAMFAFILLTRWTHAQRWPDEHVNGPFAYHADFQLRPFYPLLESVSQLKQDVPRELGIGKVDEPIHIFLFERHKTYKSYVSKYFPSVPSRPALFVKQRGPGMVFARLGPQIAIDLRHETTHAVLHSVLPMVPLWLDEGLGEYFEMPAQSRATGHPHMKAVQSQLRRKRIPSIEKLESLSELSQMHAEHYRDAWAWVHFMLHGPPTARKALQDFLQQIEAHVPPGDLSLRLRRAVPNLEGEFAAHFQRQQRVASGSRIPR